jgi:acyl-coenzyme A thioesterase PaaI-like protein
VKSEKGNQYQAGKGYEAVHGGHGRKMMRIHCKYGLSRRLGSRLKSIRFGPGTTRAGLHAGRKMRQPGSLHDGSGHM